MPCRSTSSSLDSDPCVCTQSVTAAGCKHAVQGYKALIITTTDGLQRHMYSSCKAVRCSPAGRFYAYTYIVGTPYNSHWRQETSHSHNNNLLQMPGLNHSHRPTIETSAVQVGTQASVTLETSGTLKHNHSQQPQKLTQKTRMVQKPTALHIHHWPGG